MASSFFYTFCSVSLLLLRALISPGSMWGNMAMAMKIIEDEEDSMGLLPFGSAAGSFGRFSRCRGPPRTIVATEEAVGVCYGTKGDNLPEPREVVELCKSNGIKRIRIYDPNKAMLDALRGSNIEVIVGIPNTDIEHIANVSSAASWVQRNIQAYVPNIKFRYIAVGNEVQLDDSFASYVLPAMKNIHSAIVAANLQDQIKVSTAISIGLLGSSFPPSAGSFSSVARKFIEPIISFLAKNGSPLLANVYPYYSYTANPTAINLEYVLFTASQPAVVDGNLEYYNFVITMMDALHAALEKSDGGNVSIVISESGWPSGGGKDDPAIGKAVAQTYYGNLMRFVQTGTPRRPGKAIETYLYAMFDENMMASEMEKHFGLFKSDKTPKFPLQFS